MLDKSIEFKRIVMRGERAGMNISPPVLPGGYAFRFYETGDAAHWARIETSVLEFDSEDDARRHFAEEFLPHEDELRRRCVFVLRPDGLPIATATAWFSEEHPARLHWVAVCPEEQGRGIGKAITLKVLEIFRELAPAEPIWLFTQTWSRVAVKMYEKLGFRVPH